MAKEKIDYSLPGWMNYAKSLKEMKKNHIFECYTKEFAKKCESKKDLVEKVKAYKDLAPIDSPGDARDMMELHGNMSENYPGARVINLIRQMAYGGREEPIYQKFIGALNEIDWYFDKVLEQDPPEELEKYWEHINSLKE
jgi:hypothetical protein